MKKAFTLLAFGAIATAYGHPGHDLMDHGVAHVVGSPFHLTIVTALGLVLGAAAFLVRTPRSQNVLRAASAVCLTLAVFLALIR